MRLRRVRLRSLIGRSGESEQRAVIGTGGNTHSQVEDAATLCGVAVFVP